MTEKEQGKTTSKIAGEINAEMMKTTRATQSLTDRMVQEIESLRQQLAAAQTIIEGLNGRFAKDQYRIKCQAEQLAHREAQIVMLRDALNGIADPITAMRASLEEGQILDGQMAVRLSESHVYLKQKAKDALAATDDLKEKGK